MKQIHKLKIKIILNQGWLYLLKLSINIGKVIMAAGVAGIILLGIVALAVIINIKTIYLWVALFSIGQAVTIYQVKKENNSKTEKN